MRFLHYQFSTSINKQLYSIILNQIPVFAAKNLGTNIFQCTFVTTSLLAIQKQGYLPGLIKYGFCQIFILNYQEKFLLFTIQLSTRPRGYAEVGWIKAGFVVGLLLQCFLEIQSLCSKILNAALLHLQTCIVLVAFFICLVVQQKRPQ